MAETWNKLFTSLLSSSIWTEDDQTRLVWITMLALMDRHSYVGASVNGLARQAGVSLEAAEKAIAKFLAPDKYSRSQEHEGRRIAVADRGWMILNGPRFRDMRDEEVRRQYERDRKRAQRASVRDKSQMSAQAEAESEAEREPDTESAPAARVSVESPEERPRGEPIRKPEGVDAQTWSDWLRIRRAKHLALTQTAMKVLAREASKAGKTVPEVLVICVERGWAGFQASWLLPGAAPGKSQKPMEHFRNMPWGTPSCDCERCVATRANKGASA